MLKEITNLALTLSIKINHAHVDYRTEVKVRI